MYLTKVLIFCFVIKNIYCFNIDTNYPIVYTDPIDLKSNSNKSSYFGYSLVLYPGNDLASSWLIIGAPRGQNKNGRFTNQGECFKCGIGKKCDAIELNFDDDPNVKLDGAWIGGSMDINYYYKRVVICGYRSIVIDSKSSSYYMKGKCSWFHVNENITRKFIPLFDSNRDIYSYYDSMKRKTFAYDYAQGEAGFSVHMPSTKTEQLVLGAPGVYNWQGTTILLKDQDGVESRARRYPNHDYKRSTNKIEFGYNNVASAKKTKGTFAYDLLGYSTTSGYFFGNKSNLFYASGAPRSEYLGQVLIYEFKEELDEGLKVVDSKLGTQFGEYFGAAVTAGDINGDGYDDLIVGAPYFTGKKYNEGRIVIYMGSNKKLQQYSKSDNVISGDKPNGQFGSSLQFLGDINHDGYGDLAVAAPYEEEKSGVVYLYRGQRNGLDTTPCQRIVGKDIFSEIRGFGTSISRPADVDSNAYSDIAIGAYLSGHVVLLRTRSVVTIKHDLESFSSRLKTTQKTFEVKACFWYELDQQRGDTVIRIERVITIDQGLGRAILNGGNYKETISLTRNLICQNLTINLRESIADFSTPLTISLSHEMITEKEEKRIIHVSKNIQGTDGFCSNCPIYNQLDSSPSKIINVPFSLGCKLDSVCKAQVEFEPELIDIGDDGLFVLGSKNYLTLQTTVKNLGENAYLTQIMVTIPESVNFRSTPSACMEVNLTSVSCSVANPLKNQAQKTVSLELDMTNINNGNNNENSLDFIVEVLTTSENKGVHVKPLTLKLKREADVTISGKSGEQSYSYGNITQGKPNFTQIYQVETFGRSILNEISIEINIPHSMKTKKSDVNFISLYRPVANVANQDVFCSSDLAYIDENIQVIGIADSVQNDAYDNKRLKRTLRQVEVFNKSGQVQQRITKTNDFEILQNRTFYLNCSMPEIICSKLICSVRPLKPGQIVNIKLRMLFDFTAVKDLLDNKDVILLSTDGIVKIQNSIGFVQSGDRPDHFELSTLFVGDSVEEKVALWIIILSIIAGLLLLLLLIMGLIKAGFFKRTKKEQLQQLKKEIELNENDVLTHELEES